MKKNSKNYIYTALILITLVFITMNTSKQYKLNQKFKEIPSKLSTSLPNIDLETINDYLIETPEVLIYIASGTNNRTKKIDNQIRNYIAKRDIENIIYFDIDKYNEPINKKNAQDFLNQKINTKKTKNKLELNDDINIVRFEEGRITKMLVNNSKTATIKEIKSFISKNKIG